ncbi:mercuric reductase [Longimicrobium sp.]|uniref:dihydrolipoyl dehydrogenase family protein n=1 Tax=Longimicrobium sp. TaxID=2029185 RepID=UPI002BC9AA13|nr:mercuric reductase [Longimicrobium sp.]HSU14323.1 mercuric reductase [Longimicrobium sp.]
MRYDVIVIGAGQGGVPLAALLAESGRTVLLAERSEVGGTCVNRGCTPSKSLIASAQAAHDARRARRLGVNTAVEVDFRAVMERVDGIVHQWREGVRQRLERAGERLTVVQAHARLAGPRKVEIEGETHEAETIVLNVGTRHAVPRIPGLDAVPFLTNGSIFALRELPERLVCVGGGYIGCELGQAFRRLGAEVTIIDPGDRLLAREDPQVSAEIEKQFAAEGIGVRKGSRPARVERREDDVVVTMEDGSEAAGSHLLVATGRTPNTGDLGCDAAGVRLDERGFVAVDDGFRTSAEGVFAIGDCTGGPQFTHRAWDDGRILFDILTGQRSGGRDGRLVPYAMFTDPQVGRVGMTEREAREQELDVEVAEMPFAGVARAVEADVPAGVMRILVDRKTERFVGASIVGAQAGELVHVFSVLMQAGATARTVVDTEFIHPTFAEGLQTLVMKLPRYALAPCPASEAAEMMTAAAV